MSDTEASLPTREQAAAAFEPALAPAHLRVRTALDHLAAAPPQVLILEGGTAEERYAMALWHTARLNCQLGLPGSGLPGSGLPGSGVPGSDLSGSGVPGSDLPGSDLPGSDLSGSDLPGSGLSGSDLSGSGKPEKPCLRCSACLHIGAGMFEDLFVLDGRDGGIKIAAVRELRVVLGEPPKGAGKRVIVLAEAQFLGMEAANGLLKSLEEPRPGICFLLLAPQRERLLPTLVSRGWALTLAWPEAGASLPPSLVQWEEALAEFVSSGQGWFARTAPKGAVDAAGAREVLLVVQKAVAAVLVGRAATPLCRSLSLLPPAGYLYISDVLKQCQESLDAMVNPALVLDWLATRLYLACNRTKR